MVAHKIQIAAELIVEGKRLYERTLTPLRDIAAFMGISRGTLEARIREWKWERRRHTGQSVSLLHAIRGAAIATVTGEMATPSASQPVSLEQRMALAARIQDAVEREIAAVERVLEKVAPADDSEVERSARTLASISRTLRELAALNQPDEVTPPDDTDDDPVPCDIDEFRRELARRIRGFIEAERIGAAGIPGNAEAPLA
jgi:DNA-binding Lrp family transcriptional regulator